MPVNPALYTNILLTSSDYIIKNKTMLNEQNLNEMSKNFTD